MTQSSVNKIGLTIAVASALLLSSCAREISPNVYNESHVGEASRSFRGSIISVREITVTAGEHLEDNSTGIGLGAVAGGLAGNQFGSGSGNIAATVGGAVLGGVAGAFAEKQLKSQTALEYIVELDNRELRTVVQGTEPRLSPGTRVILMIGQKGRSRIVADSNCRF